MKQKQTQKIQDMRKNHNLELIRRMRDGDPLKSFDSRASWYPPRPIIEKDEKAISQLYGKEASKKNQLRASRKDDVLAIANSKNSVAEQGAESISSETLAPHLKEVTALSVVANEADEVESSNWSESAPPEAS